MTGVPLKGLQAFEAVGRRGSVTAAADELGVSPGAISQQLRKVEAYAGAALIERHGRTVELTSLGRLYHKEITAAFTQFETARQVLQKARNDGSIVVSALSSVVNKWIGRKIFDWQSLHPSANVRIIGQDGEPRLGIDDVDFRITYGQRASSHHHYTELYRDWVVPACAPALIADGIAAPGDILSKPLIHVEWESQYTPFPHWRDFAAKVGAPTSEMLPGLSFTLSSSAIDAAINKRGFVLAQLSMITDELAAQTLVVPFDIRMPLPESYFLAWDRSALQKPFGSQFRSWIAQLAHQQILAPPQHNDLEKLK